MFARLKLFLLELRLQSHLGKWHAYRNECHDQGAASTQDRLRIAQAILHGPALERSRRWYDYVRLTQRGEQAW